MVAGNAEVENETNELWLLGGRRSFLRCKALYTASLSTAFWENDNEIPGVSAYQMFAGDLPQDCIHTVM